MRPVWVFSLGFLSFCGMFALAQLPTLEAQSQVSTTAIVVDSASAIEKNKKEFRAAVVKVAEQSFKAGEISRAELRRIRGFSLVPKVLDAWYQVATEDLIHDGLATSAKAIDWNALLAFIKELIPLILELIKLFS